MNRRNQKGIGKKWSFLIIGITIILAILSMVFGSVFYTSKNGQKSFEYAGGAEILVKVESTSQEKLSPELRKQVIRGVTERVNPNNLSSIKLAVESGDKIRVTVSGTRDKAALEKVEGIITNKPTLSLYTAADKPVFINGRYNESERQLNVGETDSAPLLSGGAKVISTYRGKIKVQIQLANISAQNEWEKATAAIAKKGAGKNQMVIWLNHGIAANVKSSYSYKVSEYNNSLRAFANSKGYYGNLYNFLFVNNNPKNKVYKVSLPLPAKSYMLSNATVGKVLVGSTFVIEGNFNRTTANDLAKDINYGVSDYRLTKVLSHFVTANYGSSAFNNAVIAGLIVLSLVAIFMVTNYGLLGAISTISISLYIFLTLLMFTVMRGEYSPSTIAALIIGIGMSVDANIITFERLKSEVYKGNSIRKSNGIANRLSLSTIFDANITTIIVGFVLFYFGSSTIRGFSIMLILSIVFTLLVMLIFTRLLSTLLVKTGIFDEKIHLLGAHKKYINNTYKNRGEKSKLGNYDFIKQSKWFVLGSSIIVGVAVIVFSITAGIAGSLSGGVNSSIDFAGGTVVDIQGKGLYIPISKTQADKIRDYLITDKKITKDEIKIIYQGEKDSKDDYIVKVSTKKVLNIQSDDQNQPNTIQDWVKKNIKNSEGNGLKVTVVGDQVTNQIATSLVKNAMIAIIAAMLAIVIYTLIRFRWTYSFGAIIALVHDGLIVTAVFVIVRAQISPIFIAALLSVIGYSINDTIVTFDRIREKMTANVGELTKTKLKNIANEAVRDTLKRSLLTSATTLSAVLILMFFKNATKFTFNLAMLVGLVSGTYSSIFIATYLWYKLELVSLRRRVRNANSHFWQIKGIEEQTIKGINDFKK